MERDPWLDRWLPLMTNQAGQAAVLELGCGAGRDTAVLAQAGFVRLVVIDVDQKALAECLLKSPAAIGIRHDLRSPLPFPPARFDIVLASLCLHYFDWHRTQALALEIRDCLVPGGLLLCRVNSIGDIHHGAVGHPELDRHFYLVEGRTKRFFDRDAIDALFNEGWERVSTREVIIDRYEKPKLVWEVVLRSAS